MNNRNSFHSIVFKSLLLVVFWGLTACGEQQEKKIHKEDLTTTRSGIRPNIILMIGDGMGLSQITAGKLSKNGPLELERFKKIGLMTTHSTKLITDSAASATAMATGQKTYNGAISMDKQGNHLPTILELAEEDKMVTGVISSSSVTHATPASFYGHQPNRSGVNRKLALQFMEKEVEVLMGGGWNYFDEGKDGFHPMEELKSRGYHLSKDIQKLGDFIPKKMICLIAPEHPERQSIRGPFLPLATKKGVEVLSQYEDAFFLIVEGAQIDWGGHENDSDYIIEEMLDFDKAIGNALNFAEKDGNTLVIVTADHETGGYSINGQNKETDSLETSFTTDYHTATMVPVFAFGPGAEQFAGVYDNTDVFKKMKRLLFPGK